MTGAMAGLIACAGPTPYQPVPEPDQAQPLAGYSDTQTGPTTYTIKFDGNWLTPRHRVADFALYRAAEVTRMAGGDHFQVRNRSIDEHIIPRALADWSSNPLGSGLKSVHPAFIYRATLDIEIGQGPAPAGAGEAHNVEDLLRRLHDRIEDKARS